MRYNEEKTPNNCVGKDMIMGNAKDYNLEQDDIDFLCFLLGYAVEPGRISWPNRGIEQIMTVKLMAIKGRISEGIFSPHDSKSLIGLINMIKSKAEFPADQLDLINQLTTKLNQIVSKTA